MVTNIGIHGLGLFLPPEIRRNDHWPTDVVASWARRPGPALDVVGLTPLAARVARAMIEHAGEPFSGIRQRHVMPSGMTTTDMEVQASRQAITRAGIEAAAIDLVLISALTPDVLATNAGSIVHHRLGLPRACMTVQVDAAQHSLLSQLSLAEAMIASGRARYALLVQSSAATRLLDDRDPVSPMFGDGATAVVVGPVPAPFGVLATSHRTDGQHPHTLVASVRGSRWYDAGHVTLHVADPVQARAGLLGTVDMATEAITAALEQAHLAPSDVRVLVMHQGMPWLQRLVAEATGLSAAGTIDTLAETGHLFSALLPSTLYAAEARELVRPGDIVVMAGGGNGMVYGATVVRWGRV